MGVETDLDKRGTRREAFKWMGKRIGETAIYIGINVSAIGIVSYLSTNRTRTVEEEAWKNLEESKTIVKEDGAILEVDRSLKTKYFARDIYVTSKLITDNTGNNDIVLAITGALASNVAISYLLRNHPGLVNKSVGSLTAFSARTVDIMSTLAFAKYFNDPRFREYGLDNYFFEANPTIGKHPSERKVALIGGITALVAGYAGWKLPWAGRNFIGSVPFLAHSNYRGAHAIKSSLEIGDQVEELIQLGKDRDYIVNFLQSMRPVKKNSSMEFPTSDPIASNIHDVFPGIKLPKSGS